MIEVYKNLFVGCANDLMFTDKDWYIIHAAKEPYHRQAIGYKERALNKLHKEYLYAIRGNELSLNMIDTPSPDFFKKSMINAALKFIDQGITLEKKVLIHCNEGMSRSPSLAFLYMVSKHLLCPDFEEAKEEFNLIYPDWKPKGIFQWIQANWNEYV